MNKNMKTIITTIVLAFNLFGFSYATNSPDWGKTGHRAVGEIAAKHLKKSTQKKINQLLNGESLASVSIYSDEIRSDPKFKSYSSWHYVNFAADKKYGEEPINPKGDVLQGIKTCIDTLRNPLTKKEDKVFHLKFLVHLVGDLHQPLHVGNASDKGGNDIKLEWHGEHSNLHRVWDTDMLESYKMSYTELANNTAQKTKEQIETIESGTLLDWAYESKKLAEIVYPSAAAEENLRYKYSYNFLPMAREQIQKSGIRLAFLIEAIFGKKNDEIDAFLAGI